MLNYFFARRAYFAFNILDAATKVSIDLQHEAAGGSAKVMAKIRDKFTIDYRSIYTDRKGVKSSEENCHAAVRFTDVSAQSCQLFEGDEVNTFPDGLMKRLFSPLSTAMFACLI